MASRRHNECKIAAPQKFTSKKVVQIASGSASTKESLSFDKKKKLPVSKVVQIASGSASTKESLSFDKKKKLPISKVVQKASRSAASEEALPFVNKKKPPLSKLPVPIRKYTNGKKAKRKMFRFEKFNLTNSK